MRSRRPGRDTLTARQGADTIIDTRGPTLACTGTTGSGRDVIDVRDGRGDDTVVRGAGHSSVIADPNDHFRRRSGNVLGG